MQRFPCAARASLLPRTPRGAACALGRCRGARLELVADRQDRVHLRDAVVADLRHVQQARGAGAHVHERAERLHRLDRAEHHVADLRGAAGPAQGQTLGSDQRPRRVAGVARARRSRWGPLLPRACVLAARGGERSNRLMQCSNPDTMVFWQRAAPLALVLP